MPIDRNSKRPFDSRLNSWERLLQRIPNYILVLLSIIIIILGEHISNPDKDESDRNPDSLVKLVKLMIETTTPIAVFSSALIYYKEAPDRKESKQYMALRVIDNATKLRKSYARHMALEELNNSHVSLGRLDLSGADLESISLKGIK